MAEPVFILGGAQTDWAATDNLVRLQFAESEAA